MKLKQAANNLARIIEQVGLEAIDGWATAHGNTALPNLIRQCIKDVDTAEPDEPTGLRDTFAAAALTGLLADYTYEDGPADAARRAYDYADAMLGERQARQ